MWNEVHPKIQIEMIKYTGLLFLIVITSQITYAQNESKDNLKDSINSVYTAYYSLLKTQDSLQTSTKDSLTKLRNSIESLKSNYSQFNETIESISVDMSEITEKELFSDKEQLRQRKDKIIHTVEFVNAANTSLNSIQQFDATSSYLNIVSSLNNPQNVDLGFSLTKEITNVLKETIIKGNNKLNGIKSNRFLSIVDNIISSPITESITSAIPVVNSIKSVIDLVMGTAIQGNDIKVEAISELKSTLRVYIEHYAALAKAQSEFEQSLANLNLRKDALTSLLTQYASERINTLQPNSISKPEDIENLNNILLKYYEKDLVERKVNHIINEHKNQPEKALNNRRLFYPGYAISQAKLITDEINALTKEYISAYDSYQNQLVGVLTNSKKNNIGDASKINAKIQELEKSLNNTKSSFKKGVNNKRLNTKFKSITRY